MSAGAPRPGTDEEDRLTLAAAGANGSWDWNIASGELFIDERFAALYGLDPDVAGRPLPTSTFFAAIHPDDRPRLRIAVAGILAGAERFSKEYRLVRPDGSVLWVHARGQGHADDHDEPVRFTGLLIDVTERRRAEERLRIAQTAGGVGTFEYAEGYATVAVSEQFCRLLGLHPASALPVRTINGVAAPGQSPIIPEQVAATTGIDGEFRIVRNDDGEERWVARRGEIVRDLDGHGFRIMGVLYDVTDSKTSEARLRELNETLEARVQAEIAVRLQAEDTLRQAQKMEAVGQLTGGIAHDFNNLLTVIRSSVDLLRRPDLGEQRRTRYIDAIADTADRAAKLTRQLLAFARRQALKPEVFDVGRCIDGIADMLRTVIGARVQLVVERACDDCFVEADVGQFETALVNMAVNARDAMSGEGRLVIRIDSRPAVPAVRGHSAASGSFIAVAVTDTGAGIPADVLARLFEPFFTTKEVGKGTGLGLSQVYGFAKQSGGEVEVTSEVGRGATFTLFLPRASARPEATDEARPVVQPRGQGRILVVEDNDQVNEFASDLLSDLGYETISVANAADAIGMLERLNGQFDLLFSDVVMPGISGVELATIVRDRWPAIQIVLTSGYSHVLATDAGHGFALLHKPYSVEELAAAIREQRVPRALADQ
jgi:PAS domain S-box-containing protein